ncbi:MAG: hypothetical protein ACOY3X_09460 [Pseudomonadota bacterium]
MFFLLATAVWGYFTWSAYQAGRQSLALALFVPGAVNLCLVLVFGMARWGLAIMAVLAVVAAIADRYGKR